MEQYNSTIAILIELKSPNNKNHMKIAIEQLADIKRERVTKISVFMTEREKEKSGSRYLLQQEKCHGEN